MLCKICLHASRFCDILSRTLSAGYHANHIFMALQIRKRCLQPFPQDQRRLCAVDTGTQHDHILAGSTVIPRAGIGNANTGYRRCEQSENEEYGKYTPQPLGRFARIYGKKPVAQNQRSRAKTQESGKPISRKPKEAYRQHNKKRRNDPKPNRFLFHNPPPVGKCRPKFGAAFCTLICIPLPADESMLF